MFKNYLKIAWRNLGKNKLFSFINISGLAIGMLAVMLISLWVWDEVGYNKSFKNHEHIASIYRRYTEPLDRSVKTWEWVQYPMAGVIKLKYGHIFRHVVLTRSEMEYNLTLNDRNFTARGRFATGEVIEMFSLKMLRGGANSMDDPTGIIISSSTATTLFGNSDPVNQTIKLNNHFEVKVSGVYQDVPSNSILGTAWFIGNLEHLKKFDNNIASQSIDWGNTSSNIWVQTADNVSMEQAEAAIRNFYFSDAPPETRDNAKKYQQTLWLHPMDQWYLYSDFKDGYAKAGRAGYVWLFGIIGAFILLLACINFVNLSTARSEKRAKEVGIRKAIGSMRAQLIGQFLSESFMVVFLSFLISVLLIWLVLPAFNELTSKSIRLPFTNLYFWIDSFVFLALTALLAGLYPAIYLSSFQPVKVLKGIAKAGRYASLPRKILVVVQFTVSVIMIIGTTIVYQQIRYTQDRPTGYTQENLLRISVKDPLFEKQKMVMKQALLNSGVVSAVALSNSPVTAIWGNWGGFSWRGKDPRAEANFTTTYIDEDYGKTIQWKIVQGRDFSKDFSMDADGVIINEAAAKYMKLENPVGEYITHDFLKMSRQIIGVVKDVIVQSPYENVSPGFYWFDPKGSNLFTFQVRLRPDQPVHAALAKIEAIQKQLLPSAPFSYSFTDQDYGKKFAAEQRLGKLATLFAILAIFISCLGLFGLASFVAEQRTKEIGIRKVLGATVANIWKMLSTDFVLLIVISCCIASPIAYYYLDQWLEKYSYRIHISGWVFVCAAAGSILLTLLTISWQAIKAAMMNPVKSLRSE
ncbi:FtsX-like permease family protein [Sediminibacterium roseum]|uniref:FtsX-like permease family protein n=1 Tax=Sediminibacterium roseum TaxID=1978412 RepID=A0ABW9ZY21_9BACT|nr:ABC transporter permease [Sediminibacterium roseum]NCI50938.1 FtsX-like permease family protein [Sediminibacterium roseum]